MDNDLSSTSKNMRIQAYRNDSHLHGVTNAQKGLVAGSASLDYLSLYCSYKILAICLIHVSASALVLGSTG